MDQTYSSDGSAAIHDIFKWAQHLDPNLLAPFVADWDLVDNNGETILHQVMRSFRVPSHEFVASLIELGADVRPKSHDGLEPIHVAAAILVARIRCHISQVQDPHFSCSLFLVPSSLIHCACRVFQPATDSEVFQVPRR